MILKLRTWTLLFFMLFAHITWADEVVFDLSNYLSCKLFGFTEPSSNSSHGGDITEEKTAKINDVSITVLPNPNKGFPNKMWTNSLRLFVCKLIVKAPKPIKELVMELNHDKWGDRNTANNGKLTRGHWVGDNKTVEISIASNTRIQKLTVKYGDVENTPGEQKVYTLHDLCQTKEELTDVEIKLTDAKVLYCFYTNAWIRQGEDAIMLYLTGIDYQTNDVVNGTFRADFQNYKGTPEIKGNFMTTKADKLQIEHSEEAAQPIKITFDELLTKKYLSNLVELKDMNVVVEDNNFFIVNNGRRIQLYNKLQLDMEAIEDGAYTVRGIVTLHDYKVQLYPTELIPSTTSGIYGMKGNDKQTNHYLYNLAGQRVGKDFKGIVISNGKTMVKP